MEITYMQMAEEDIPAISVMEEKYFASPWSESGIRHYLEAGQTIFVVAKDAARSAAGPAGAAAAGASAGPNEPAATGTPAGPNEPAAGPAEACVRSSVIGYAAVLCTLDEGNLVSIAVDEAYRDMGIATELLDFVYDIARDWGVASINLEVRESNDPAISLYEKEGFGYLGRRPGFYSNPKEDALLFEKKL